MALINLTTNLKSLKFGNDQYGGGSSNQPYIQTPIPNEFGEYGFINQDFLLRGGSRAATDSLIDVERLGKYFIDTKNPSGILFTVKQNLLSRTAVRTQASTGFLNEGIYTPLSTLTQAGVNAFGIHVNKQGLNPFDGIGSLRTYNEIVNPELGEAFSIINKDKNRLVKLQSLISTGTEGERDRGVTLNDSNGNLMSYRGGPDSVLGIGKTNIKFADQRTVYTDKTFESGNKLSQNNVLTYTNKEIFGIPTAQDFRVQGESFVIQNRSTTVVGDFRTILRRRGPRTSPDRSGIIIDAPDYTIQNIEQRVNLGNPGDTSVKDLRSYTLGAFAAGTPLGAASPSSYDKINVYPIYQSENVTTDPIVKDLVQFRIGVYDLKTNNPFSKNYIHFRAFINQISDTYASEWSDTRYIGRGEKFYNYTGFDRKVSLSWTVAAQSKAELIPMYKKLNYLASICAPDYSPTGYMRGNIVTLTIGGYLHEQPGIITGFSYEMNDENATWEIGINDEGGSDDSVKELPHLIKVNGFNFIPIHDFVPRLQQNVYEGPNDSISEYGDERFIALNADAATDTNYDDTNDDDTNDDDTIDRPNFDDLQSLPILPLF
jgi:hypothetical protein